MTRKKRLAKRAEFRRQMLYALRARPWDTFVSVTFKRTEVTKGVTEWPK